MLEQLRREYILDVALHLVHGPVRPLGRVEHSVNGYPAAPHARGLEEVGVARGTRREAIDRVEARAPDALQQLAYLAAHVQDGHFAVRVRKRGSAAITGKVLVYVQRQHSLEV